MRVALIPARGGSKRIPKKNIKMFAGKPMIGWTIQSALESRIFNRVVVSTDSYEIGRVAEEFGAEMPFERPAKLSDDVAGTREVILHAIEELSLSDDDIVACLYATAPFMEASKLIEASEVIRQDPEAFVYSVGRFSYPIQRAVRIREDGKSEMIWPENNLKRSQDLEETYHDAGQFYMGSVSSWKTRVNTFDGGRPVVLNSERVQDIDNAEDWVKAENMMKALGIS